MAIRSNWSTLSYSSEVISELCFRYEYDYKYRMTAKKIPGSGWLYMVYDNLDRLVFSQDANLREKDQWMTTLYDVLNRPVTTGILEYSNGREALQTYVDGVNEGLSTISVTQGTPSSIEANTSYIHRDTSIRLYQASESITFLPSFETDLGDDLIAEVVHPGSSFDDLINVALNPLPSGYDFIALTITHYDDYEKTNNGYKDTYTSKLEQGTNPYPEAVLSVEEQRQVNTRTLTTITRVRVLEDPNDLTIGKWLSSTIYYDHKARIVQSQNENYLGGIDISSNRYDFIGEVISTYLVHRNPKSTGSSLTVATLMNYDHGGRLLEIWKTINDEFSKKALIVKNEYDLLSQLKTKQLGRRRNQDGSYGNVSIETLDYNYNIRGWLKGINAAYSHPELNSGVSPDRWFGMELNYDWGSTQTNKNQLNGNISSTTWKSRGDGVRRAYGYSYDKANRLLGADFSENNGSGFADNGAVDFDMMIGDGIDASTAYDENGNIKAMSQWGLKLNSSAMIDQLTYSYHVNSNKLKAVAEPGATVVDNKLSDFTDKHKGAEDYGYDKNGNLITDLNKNLNGSVGLDQVNGGSIQYNQLNLPWTITVKNEAGTATKGSITYIYDAVGTKLEKRVVENASADNANVQKQTVTTYIGGMVYEQINANPISLQFLAHEEGRVRIKKSETESTYNYDYFLKDHLGNVRMVLTDEAAVPEVYQATMEDSRRAIETAQFGDKISSSETPKSSHPGFDQDNSNAKISAVNGNSAATRIGPGVVLKVMSGDKIKASTFAWYQSGGDNSVSQTLPAFVSTLLGQVAGGISAAGKVGGDALASNSVLTSDLTSFLNSQPGPGTSTPKAYLNWILLDDEQFKKVDGSSGFKQVPLITGSQEKQAMFAKDGDEIEVTKNGYIYVYVSNESKMNVYFDDIRVEHMRGQLLEETHYYPFGLTMAGVSSQAMLTLRNKIGFNGNETQNKEFSDLSGLELYDFNARSYDAQVGRFMQIDPEAEEGSQECWSPYHFSFNNPVLYSDRDGRIPIIGFVRAAATAYRIYRAVRTLQKVKDVAARGVQTRLIKAEAFNLVAENSGLLTGYIMKAVAEQASNSDGEKTSGRSTPKVEEVAGEGRGKNNRKPDPNATGDHTVSNDRGSTTYNRNDRNPKTGFDEVKRVDTKGKADNGVPTPHVHEKGVKGARPANSNEIPKTDLSKNKATNE